MIEIKNLTKKYGQITAVNDISFTANKNEILGFLGPNGAGKSTTMNMIVGYLPPTSGEILIDGMSMNDNPKEVKKKIGYLPELPPLYLDMKVIEYLRFVAGIKEVPKKEREHQVARALSRLKITDMKNRVIRNLSKGYRQRVGFAQALIGDPQVLILDEPTVGLDPNQTMEVRNLINMLRKDHTIIFSSHILQEVSAVCDRIVIIDKGEIKAVDTKDRLIGASADDIVYIIRVEGVCSQAENTLREIKGIKNIMEINFLDENTSEFKVELESEDVRKLILTKMMENNLSIAEIKKVSMSLEDVFASFTRGKSYSGLAASENSEEK
ncbi:MAG: ATP-binding cassette domain-containing protein [Oscillospiraceae bacterium]|nr:ABC transporter ATP-binding protein [Oscillospiraceae bacterium]MDD6082922.1 ATP-binding cassette domain-containing protein [Oscillospiraceae bacterium]